MVDIPQFGVRLCMKCGRLFVSPDPKRIRRCGRCKKVADDYQPKRAAIASVEEAIRSQDG